MQSKNSSKQNNWPLIKELTDQKSQLICGGSTGIIWAHEKNPLALKD